MREEAVYRFLELLGLDRSRMQKSRQWINTFCPLAPYTHSAGVDTRPSFGVSISEDRRSVYYCFGCAPEPRRLESLLHSIFVLSGSYPTDAAKLFAREENHYIEDTEPELELPENVWAKERKVLKQLLPLPYGVLNLFPVLQWSGGLGANACRVYLEDERKIPRWVYNYFQVRYDPKRLALVFPLTDGAGKIFVLRERSIKEKEIWTVNESISGIALDYPKLKDVGAWFGMHLANRRKPLILVEGELDAMRLCALGYRNVIASATSSVTDAQLAVLGDHTLILGYDSDTAGRAAHEKIRSKLDTTRYIGELDWSRAGRKDAGDLRDELEWRKVYDGKRSYTKSSFYKI